MCFQDGLLFGSIVNGLHALNHQEYKAAAAKLRSQLQGLVVVTPGLVGVARRESEVAWVAKNRYTAVQRGSKHPDDQIQWC